MITLRMYLKDVWILIKTGFQLMHAMWWLHKLPRPSVTFFGGARLKVTSDYAELAHELAYRLVKSDISIITGGGSGIMDAANCGARHALKNHGTIRSIGITVKGLMDERPYARAQKHITVNQFWARKVLLTHYAVAFAVFPGGFGTLDELAEVVTLMQTKQLAGVPIVLIGSDYWQPFVDWLTDSALAQGMISKDDLAMIQVTDDLDEALKLLKKQCVECTP